jgi:hypothetical protein
MKFDTKTLLIILAAVIVLGGLYWYFFTGAPIAPPVSVTTGTQSQAQAQFQTLIGELDPISFNLSIFSDARFLSLVDIATPITPEAAGRTDPFAPFTGSTKGP